jgi:hypothetical protein
MQTGSSALAPCGARRAAAQALPRTPPATGWPPSPRRAHPRKNGHPPGAPVLSRAKITVKSAPACGLRVLRMALRATLDCDLPRHVVAPIRRMGHERAQTVAQSRLTSPYSAAVQCPEHANKYNCLHTDGGL